MATQIGFGKKKNTRTLDLAAFNAGNQTLTVADCSSARAPGAPAGFFNQGNSCATSATLQELFADPATAASLANYPCDQESTQLFLQLHTLAPQYILALLDPTDKPLAFHTDDLSQALRAFVSEKERVHMGEEDASNSDAPGARRDLFLAAIMMQEQLSEKAMRAKPEDAISRRLRSLVNNYHGCCAEHLNPVGTAAEEFFAFDLALVGIEKLSFTTMGALTNFFKLEKIHERRCMHPELIDENVVSCQEQAFGQRYLLQLGELVTLRFNPNTTNFFRVIKQGTHAAAACL